MNVKLIFFFNIFILIPIYKVIHRVVVMSSFPSDEAKISSIPERVDHKPPISPELVKDDVKEGVGGEIIQRGDAGGESSTVPFKGPEGPFTIGIR